jgi:hypothetical protein
MPKRTTVDEALCPLHGKLLPCLSCRAAKGGSAKSLKKTLANRKKARRAALIRWGRVEHQEQDARVYQ